MNRRWIMQKYNISNMLPDSKLDKRLSPTEEREFEEFIKTVEKFMRKEKTYRLMIWRKS